MIQIKRNPSVSELRRFASIWLPLFGAALGAGAWRAGETRATIAVGATTFALALTSWMLPAVARALFLGLSYITFPIGFVTSWVALGIVYFAVLTPIALVRRVLGTDVLHRGRDTTASTYWRRRQESSDRASAFRQF